MASFFDKLKKGMGVEEEIENSEDVEKETPKVVKKRNTRRKNVLAKTQPVQKLVVNKAIANETEEPIKESENQPEITPKETPQEIDEEKPEEEVGQVAFKDNEPEGQLAIDVYQTDDHLIIQSAIAGIRPEALDVSMESDIVTIKGIREKPFEEKGDYLSQECYWGAFAREIALPVEISPEQSEAIMNEGILTIRLPKIQRDKKRKINVKLS